jgi:hypothetical protein
MRATTLRNYGNNTSTTRVMTPVQLRQQCQHDKDKEDTIATTAKTRQRCQHDEGDDASMVWARTPE